MKLAHLGKACSKDIYSGSNWSIDIIDQLDPLYISCEQALPRCANFTY